MKGKGFFYSFWTITRNLSWGLNQMKHLHFQMKHLHFKSNFLKIHPLYPKINLLSIKLKNIHDSVIFNNTSFCITIRKYINPPNFYSKCQSLSSNFFKRLRNVRLYATKIIYPINAESRLLSISKQDI